jgi:hypothetical protein
VKTGLTAQSGLPTPPAALPRLQSLSVSCSLASYLSVGSVVALFPLCNTALCAGPFLSQPCNSIVPSVFQALSVYIGTLLALSVLYRLVLALSFLPS